MPLRLLKRIKLRDTTIGKILQTVAGVVGLGSAVAVSTGAFQITGSELVDIITIICVTIAAIFGAKLPVAPEDQHKIEE